MTTSFAQRGLVAEWGLSWLLTRLVGPSHALDLLYTARKVKGDEAARIGLVNRALPGRGGAAGGHRLRPRPGHRRRRRRRWRR